MSDDDLDAAIVDARASDLSEHEVCRRFGCTIGRVHAALDKAAARTLAPENAQAMLIRSLDTLKTVERTFAGRRGVEARRIVNQARRQQARTARLILQRAPASRPV